MLGMAPQRDEGLLMALGAKASGPGVASASKRFQLLFEFDEQLPLNWQRASNMPETSRCQEFLRKHFRRRRFDHIAGGWHGFVTEFIAAWVGRCAHKTEIRDLVVCGDLFELNELMPVASRQRHVVSLSGSQLPGSAGNAIGAAMLIAAEREPDGPKSIKPILSPYHGQDATPESCERALATVSFGPDIAVERPEELPRRVAALVAAGAVLARFGGKEDIRQRGLGNRSLLARADHPQAREKLTELANTDSFWTNLPVLWLAERLRAAFVEADTLPEAVCGEFSLTPRHANPFFGFHRGHRATVQAISRLANPAFWEILDACVKASGRAPILTEVWRQMDGHLVKDPLTAVTLWRDQGLSGLILGDWLVYRTDLAVSPAMAAGTRRYIGAYGDE
jgi:predicted NodU family carbamoyl transferase